VTYYYDMGCGHSKKTARELDPILRDGRQKVRTYDWGMFSQPDLQDTLRPSLTPGTCSANPDDQPSSRSDLEARHAGQAHDPGSTIRA